MFPDSPFAPARGSFERPVPLVLVDPCDDPAITVKINRAWVPYVLGALKQLVLQATWATNDPDALWLVQQRAMKLLSCVVTASNQPGCECGCHDYTPSADFITWQPNNPYLTPTLVPSGYRFPPWYIVGNTIPFTGLQAGDVLTDLLHGPIVEPLSSGFPRFRISTTGTGTVEVTFVRFPTAGVALITIDDNPASATWVDLHISLASGIGQAFAEMLVPIEITTGGDHHIDISMIYSITEEPPFVHFGGGIRAIALCGFGETPSTAPINVYEEMEYDMSVCEQLRWHDGKLQGLCCGVWSDITGQDSGLVPSGVTQPTDIPRPAAGDSACFTVLLQANGKFLLPFFVNNGDQVTISEVHGAWTDGAINWYCPDGTPYILGACIGSRGHASGDPDATDFHMQVIAQAGSQFYPASGGTFTLSGLSGPSQLTLQANDSPLSDNAGSVTLKICVQNSATPPVGTWCYMFDFTLSDYNPIWDIVVADEGGHWVAGSGYLADTSVTSYQNEDPKCAIPSGFAGTIDHFEAFYNLASDNSFHHGQDGGGDDSGHIGPGVSSHVFSGTVNIAAGPLYFQITHGSGDNYITGVKLSGTGTNPFGSDNC